MNLLKNNNKVYPDKISVLLSNVLDKLDSLNLLYTKSMEKSINSLYDSLAGGDYDRSYSILRNLYDSYFKIRGVRRIGTVSTIYNIETFEIEIQQDLWDASPVSIIVYEV